MFESGDPSFKSHEKIARSLANPKTKLVTSDAIEMRNSEYRYNKYKNLYQNGRTFVSDRDDTYHVSILKAIFYSAFIVFILSICKQFYLIKMNRSK